MCDDNSGLYGVLNSLCSADDRDRLLVHTIMFLIQLLILVPSSEFSMT